MSWWLWVLVIVAAWLLAGAVVAFTLGGVIREAEERTRRDVFRRRLAERRARRQHERAGRAAG
jgi:hypothetical protein